MPHAAFVTLASRLRQYQTGGNCCFCCTPVDDVPGEIYDTEVMRKAWDAAAAQGWRIAEMFNTSREKARPKVRKTVHTPFGMRPVLGGIGPPAFRDSMLVFEAPVSALQGATEAPGLANDGNIQGGFETLEGGKDGDDANDSVDDDDY